MLRHSANGAAAFQASLLISVLLLSVPGLLLNRAGGMGTAVLPLLLCKSQHIATLIGCSV
jgi:hypothetical protein